MIESLIRQHVTDLICVIQAVKGHGVESCGL